MNSFSRGIFSSVLMRWSVKFIGVFNTMILARILMPEDFGLVAMAAIFIALIEELSTVNIALLLIRKTGDVNNAANTAWTVSIIQGGIVAILLCLLAPLAVDFFSEERISEIIYFMAGIKVISGFKNIGVILARKEFNFFLDYKFMVYSRLATFFGVMSFVYFIRDYRAIIYGNLLGEFFTLLISYIIHPFRPRLSKENIFEYLKFSLNMIPYSIGRLLNNKLDVIVVGKFSNASVTGAYNICNELAYMFTKEMLMPILRGMYPNLTKVSSDRKEFNRIFINTYSFTLAICFPIVIVIWFYSKDIVFLLLGEKWIENHEYLRYLSIYGGLSSIIMVISEQTLIAIGMESKANRLMWFRVVLLSLGVYIGYEAYGILGMMQAMIFFSFLSLFFISLNVFSILKINKLFFLKDLLRISFSSFIMVICVYWFSGFKYIYFNYYVNQLLVVVLSSSIYAFSIYIFWVLSGKPQRF